MLTAQIEKNQENQMAVNLLENKEFTCHEEHNSRKVSRMKTNEDVMKRLLCTSDPIVFILQKNCFIKKKFPSDVAELFYYKNEEKTSILNLLMFLFF